MKSLISKISSYFLILVLFLQVSIGSIVNYLYVDHNEILTASCCVNKNTDPNCQAKCFVDRAQEQQEENNSVLLKKVEIYIRSDFEILQPLIQSKRTAKSMFAYSEECSTIFLDRLSRPPIA